VDIVNLISTKFDCEDFDIEIYNTPLEQFQPLQYVKSWLAKGHHAASDVGCKTHLPHSIALVTWP